MMNDERHSLKPLQGQRWTGWNENKQAPLASRDRRLDKARICASADAEGRVKSSTAITGSAWQYPMYNALGQRVEDYQGTATDSLTLTYPRDIFGQRTGIWNQWPSHNWAGWDIFWSQVAGQRLNMGGSSAFIGHADAIGSTTMETDPAGAVQWDITYGPWGQIWQQGGTRQSAVWADLDWQVNDPLIPSATREYNNNTGGAYVAVFAMYAAFLSEQLADAALSLM